MAVSSLTAMAQDKLEVAALDIRPGETKELSVALSNSKTYTAFQMDVTLPEGLRFASADGGEVVTLAAGRKQNHVVDFNEYKNGVMRIISYSNDKAAYKGNSGTLLSIRVTADDGMALGNYDVKVSGVSFTELPANDVAFDDVSGKVSVYGLYAVTATSADETRGEVTLQNGGQAVKFGTTVTATATPKPGYEFVNWTVGGVEKSKDNPYTFTVTEDVALVANFVPAHYSLTYKVDNVVVSTASIEYGAAITPIDVPTKEGYIFSGWSEIPASMPAHDVVITGTFTFDYNTDAYKRLTALIDKAQAILDAAKVVIENECKDVALDFATVIEGIQKSIDAARADVEAKYKNGELTADSTIDTVTITTTIEKLTTDAAAAQKAYEEQKAEEAKKQANEAAYTKLSAQLSEVQKSLDAAKTTIETDCKDVAVQFSATIADIQNSIDAVKSDLAAKYKNVELTAESTIDTSAITASITKLTTDAAAAQKAYEEQKAEEARKQANEAAYKTLLPQIEGMQNAVAELKSIIDSKYPELAEDFADELAEIEADVDSTVASINTMYEEIKLTADVTLEDDVKYYNEWIANILAALEAAALVPGDVNEDGKVDIADANAIVNYFIGNAPTLFNKKAADVNGDGKIDIADANAVVNIFLNK